MEDSLRGIFFRQRFVMLPVEFAAVPRCVHIGKLEQTFLSHRLLANRVLDCYFRFGMAYIRSRFQARLRPGKRLKGISPKGAFIRIAQCGKSGTVAPYLAGHTV